MIFTPGKFYILVEYFFSQTNQGLLIGKNRSGTLSFVTIPHFNQEDAYLNGLSEEQINILKYSHQTSEGCTDSFFYRDANDFINAMASIGREILVFERADAVDIEENGFIIIQEEGSLILDGVQIPLSDLILLSHLTMLSIKKIKLSDLSCLHLQDRMSAVELEDQLNGLFGAHKKLKIADQEFLIVENPVVLKKLIREGFPVGSEVVVSLDVDDKIVDVIDSFNIKKELDRLVLHNKAFYILPKLTIPEDCFLNELVIVDLDPNLSISDIKKVGTINIRSMGKIKLCHTAFHLLDRFEFTEDSLLEELTLQPYEAIESYEDIRNIGSIAIKNIKNLLLVHKSFYLLQKFKFPKDSGLESIQISTGESLISNKEMKTMGSIDLQNIEKLALHNRALYLLPKISANKVTTAKDIELYAYDGYLDIQRIREMKPITIQNANNILFVNNAIYLMPKLHFSGDTKLKKIEINILCSCSEYTNFKKIGLIKIKDVESLQLTNLAASLLPEISFEEDLVLEDLIIYSRPRFFSSEQEIKRLQKNIVKTKRVSLNKDLLRFFGFPSTVEVHVLDGE
eukprot:GHVP01052851.1.p1 GENE.GHVP01052851.1~~GHVP01052851.1.p1  ORF type:complete len:569 (+),score=84.14 GHVP01052851.1:3-1709(+)